ncbi:MAG TPA: hydroxymethylglutaryl-CoA lyase [Gammaproteobacteria bacterium]|jgi:isopropylmalate/homocitrate/citramalate synthase|nr:hydroxymethylglutaryl-CoA lyase [Gammaproteobacteria bacterium]
MTFPKQVTLVEVSPRDGLQNEKAIVPTAVKIELINRLADTGLTVIEATSFVSAKRIPQLADASAVWQGIKKRPTVRYPVLIPNLAGLENALAVGVKEIAVFTTPSEQFSQKNTHCSVTESLQRIEKVTQLAKQHGLPIRGYVSCVLGCPYEGEIAAEKVATLSKTLMALGCDEISLGDTIGVGTPNKTQQLIECVAAQVPIKKLAVHFHDTYGQALANIYVALLCGVSVIDSAAGGLGGCPYAVGASGNVATEDVLYMLNGMGIETGVDMQKLLGVVAFIARELGKAPVSRVYRALQ